MSDSISDKSIQIEILDTLDRLSSDMLSRFGKLTQADWDAPSRCDMWSVKDVGSHMAMVFAAYLNFIASRSKAMQCLQKVCQIRESLMGEALRKD